MEHDEVNGVQYNSRSQEVLSWSADGSIKLRPTSDNIYTHLKEKGLADLPELILQKYMGSEIAENNYWSWLLNFWND